MKKIGVIVISAVFSMGLVMATSAFATDSGLMSGMKGIAKEHAKGMVDEGVKKAGDTASKKIDELAGNATASQNGAVDKAKETKENVDAVKDKATHEMKEMKEGVERHEKAVEGVKDAGEKAVHETPGK